MNPYKNVLSEDIIHSNVPLWIRRIWKYSQHSQELGFVIPSKYGYYSEHAYGRFGPFNVVYQAGFMLDGLVALNKKSRLI